MSKENYDTVLPELQAIPLEEIRVPSMPVNVYVQEAYDLEAWAKDDKKAMTKVGMDWNNMLQLPVRAGALRYAQSLWMKERHGQEEARKEWDVKSPDAYKLKNDLEAAFRFAFRKRLDLLAKVQQVEQGSGDADMVQDLSDLSVLGTANKALLTSIGLDLALLRLAETKAGEMAGLLALMNGERSENNNAKIIRDRAYTHLKKVVDEIRETGKYAFRDNPEKLKGFASAHYRKTRG